MQTNGVAEHLVTGAADDWKKLAAWAATVPHTLCNPLYHWTHLELKRYFSIADCLLNTDTAREIYNHCSALLQTPAFSMRAILTRTILYVLNPADNEVIATMVGNFQDGSVPGKIQFGSGWWFNDQKDGMQRHLNALSNMGLLSRFVGMLTDSRSFLSYPRHEYFRRVLCNLLGTDMENGELPHDLDLVGGMVGDICYHNAVNYFGIDLE